MRITKLTIAISALILAAGRADAAFRLTIESGGVTEQFYSKGLSSFDYRNITINGYTLSDTTISQSYLTPTTSNPVAGVSLNVFVGFEFTGSQDISVFAEVVADNTTLDALDTTGKGVQVTGSNLTILDGLALKSLSPTVPVQGTTTVMSVTAYSPFSAPSTLQPSIQGSSTTNGTTFTTGYVGPSYFYQSTTGSVPGSPGYTLQEGLTLTNSSVVTSPPDVLFSLSGTIAVTTPTVVSSVPEPSSLALCGIAGAIGLAIARVRRKRA